MAPAKTSIKAKNMMYTQQLKYIFPGVQDQEDKLDKLKEIVEKRLKPERYALTVHSQDVNARGDPVEPHVHLMMSYPNARSLASVAKQLGDKPQYIEQWTGNANNGYAYLVHRTKSSRNRYQYDPADVIANFGYAELVTQQIPSEIARAHDEKTGTIKGKLDMLYIGAISKAELEAQLSGSELARYNRQIDVVWSKRLRRQAQEWREKMKAEGRQVETIWLYGPAGAGKSRLAKEYAAKRGQPYFIAGSSKDTFQHYEGQHTLILDELRPKTMRYEDLLRLMDPFGLTEEVMGPSRYTDKALACDLVIVTTPYSPYNFHQTVFGRKADSTPDRLEQLHRRISLLLCVYWQKIWLVRPNDTGDKYLTVRGGSRPNPYYQASGPAPDKSMDLFNAMFQ